MEPKRWWPFIVGFGVVLGFVSAFADYLGLGTTPGLGWEQRSGLVAGVALVIIGYLWKRKS